MSRTHRHPKAYRKGRGNNRIVSPILQSEGLAFTSRGNIAKNLDGSEVWGDGKRWTKRQTSKARRRALRQVEDI